MKPTPVQTKSAATDLSHVTTATHVANHIAAEPDVPVVVHWQMQDFPIRVAKKLHGAGRRILWVVATSERGDIAEQQFLKAGIAVNRVRTEPVAVEAESPTSDKMDLLRRAAQKRLNKAAAQYPQPEGSEVTIMPIGRLGHGRPLEEISRWEGVLVVYDHIGSLNTRWLTIDADADGETDDLKKLMRQRDDGAHPIPAFHRAGIPQVFLTRDMLEVVLIESDFRQRECGITLLATKLVRHENLKINVVGTNLVESKYAAGAFLSVLACNPEAQVVGEALIGAITPDKLSMSTSTPLNKAVLKLSKFSDTYLKLVKEQTKLSEREIESIRILDFARTAVLAMGPCSRKPELVVLCPWDLTRQIANFLQVTPIRLPQWSVRNKVPASMPSPFTKDVIESALNYLDKLAHASRFERIVAAINSVKREVQAKKIARLALALHSATLLGSEIDLANRPEFSVGLSSRGDRAIGLFHKIVEAVFPWSAVSPDKHADNLLLRKNAMVLYRKYRKDRDASELGANNAA